MPKILPYTLALAFGLQCLGCSPDRDAVADSAAAPDQPVTAQPAVVPESPVTPDTVESASAPPERPAIAIQTVRMLGDATGYRYEPADLTLNGGDAVTFLGVSGGPHNVVFDGSGLSSEAQTQLDRNLSQRAGPLATDLVNEAGETVTVSFAGLPPGVYRFACASHAAQGMRGSITVQ